MRHFFLRVVVVVVVALAVSEAAMQPSGRERLVLGLIFGGAGVVAVFGRGAGLWVVGRSRSISSAVLMVGVGAVAVSAVTVVLAAGSMFLSSHDRDLVLVALGLGVGLGLTLAESVSDAITVDLHRVGEAADRVAAGELAARTEVRRRDEVGRLAAAFDRMAGRLQATEEERRLLFESIGHDLRTPLASIRAAVEALEDGLAPDPAAYLSGIGKDARHLGRLVDDVFMLARLESGMFTPNRIEVDVAEIVDDALEALRPLADRTGVELRVAAVERFVMEVDPEGISRLIRNLVDNAIRHSPASGGVTVEVSEGRIRILDEGDGFPVAFRARAFERFSRADPSRSGGGTGLGLAIAKALVEAEGGRISIEDGPGGRVLVEF